MSFAEPRSVTSEPGVRARAPGPASPAARADTAARSDSFALSTRWMVLLLGALALAALLIQGGLFVHKTWLWTGDTIYHRALMAEIQAGELLPGGPYAGLPAFYSPLFHYVAAAIGSLAQIELTEAIRIISIVLAPLTPLAAYWLARVLGLDRASALVGAFFSTFAGAIKTTEDRVWVDALFVGQHNFFPVFPRDIAFLLLPLGLGCVYRAVVDGWRPGAALAGLAFGLMILAHTQTAVFAAPLIAIYLVLVLLLRRDLFRRIVQVCAVTGAVALVFSAFWWGWQIVEIVQSRSFGVNMPAYRVPVKLALEEFPAEFGVFLILGPLGLWLVTRRLLRERSLAALLLLVWFLVPVLLAVFRPTGFPGGDTFFPRRLWQFASQPLLLMAGLGLVVGVLRPLRPRWSLVGIVLIAVCLAASVPGSLGTNQRIAEFWNEPDLADQRWELDGNFAFGPFLAAAARRDGLYTVLAPTPEATLVWYYSGEKVVYLKPTAAIKLAYDVQRMTGFGEAERADDLVKAYAGDPTRLASIADKYGARYVVLKRLGDRLAGIDVPADGLAPQAEGKGTGRVVDTNHYEYLAVSPNDRVTFEVWSPSDRTATLVLRAKRRNRASATLGMLSVNGTPTTIADSELPQNAWADVRRDVALKGGRNQIQLDSTAQLEVIRVAAYSLTLADLPPSWRVAHEDGWYVVLDTRGDTRADTPNPSTGAVNTAGDVPAELSLMAAVQGAVRLPPALASRLPRWFTVDLGGALDLVVIALVAAYVVVLMPGLTRWPPLVNDEGREANLFWVASGADSSAERMNAYRGFATWGNGGLQGATSVVIFRLFGLGVFQARLTSLVWGGLLLLMVYWLGRRYWSRAVGLAAAVLLAVSNPFMIGTHTLRPDVQVATMILGALLLAERSLDATTRRPLLFAFLAGLVLGLVEDTHPNGLAFFPLVGLVYPLRQGWLVFLRRREAWVFVGGIVAAALYYLAVRFVPDPGGFIAALGYWVGVDKAPPAMRESGGPLAKLGVMLTNEILRYQDYFGEEPLELGVVLLGLAGGLWMAVRGSYPARLIWLGLAFAFLFFVVAVSMKSKYYMLLTFPLYLLLLARVLERISAWIAEKAPSGLPWGPMVGRRGLYSGILAALVLAVMIWPFKLEDRVWENYIRARRYREGQEYLQLTSRLNELAGPGARILGPPVYWIGLHDHPYSDIYVYERVERQYGLTPAQYLDDIRPDFVITDAKIATDRRVERLLYSELDSRATYELVVRHKNFGDIAVYRLRWPSADAPAGAPGTQGRQLP